MDYVESSQACLDAAHKDAVRLNNLVTSGFNYTVNDFNSLAKSVELSLQAAQVYATLAVATKQ